jgi:DNA-directed RNA polymerase specialized sigma24 family protein
VDDPLERFAGVYDRYYRNVLRYPLQHAEQGTAEDVASETFLIAWRRFPAIPDPPLPWLLGVARNLLRKQARAGLRRWELVARLALLCSAADGSALAAGDFVVERAAALDALASLPRPAGWPQAGPRSRARPAADQGGRSPATTR